MSSRRAPVLVEGGRAVGGDRLGRRHRDRRGDGDLHAGRRGGQPQLAVVPADGALDVELDPDPLVQHRLDEGLELLGVGRVVALEHADAERPQPVGVLDDLCLAHQLDPAQLLVVVAVLEEQGQARVAPQVLRLLRLGLGLDGDAARRRSRTTWPRRGWSRRATREHMVMGRRSARKASTSSGVIAIALRWFTPWPMASVIWHLPLCVGASVTAPLRGDETKFHLQHTCWLQRVSRPVHLGSLR